MLLTMLLCFIYVIGICLTYCYFNTTKQTTFNKIFFSLIWPTIVLLYPIVKICDKFIYNK